MLGTMEAKRWIVTVVLVAGCGSSFPAGNAGGGGRAGTIGAGSTGAMAGSGGTDAGTGGASGATASGGMLSGGAPALGGGMPGVAGDVNGAGGANDAGAGGAKVIGTGGIDNSGGQTSGGRGGASGAGGGASGAGGGASGTGGGSSIPCVPCKTPKNGSVACVQGACVIACNKSYVACPDDSCALPVWDFESGTAEGVTLSAGNSKAVIGPLTVSQAIASSGTHSISANIVSTGQNSNFEVRADVCGGPASANVRGKTLSAKVYLQGPALPTNNQGYIALEVFTTSAAFFPEMTRITPVIDTWMTLSVPLTDVTKELFNGPGVFLYLPADGNGSWIGKVFVDDIRID